MSRVLIVEDEAHLAQGLRFNLEAEGHSVEVAGDGESAIELLVAEVNPVLDVANRTGELGVQLISSAFGKKIM